VDGPLGACDGVKPGGDDEVQASKPIAIEPKGPARSL